MNAEYIEVVNGEHKGARGYILSQMTNFNTVFCRIYKKANGRLDNCNIEIRVNLKLDEIKIISKEHEHE